MNNIAVSRSYLRSETNPHKPPLPFSVNIRKLSTGQWKNVSRDPLGLSPSLLPIGNWQLGSIAIKHRTCTILPCVSDIFLHFNKTDRKKNNSIARIRHNPEKSIDIGNEIRKGILKRTQLQLNWVM